MFRSSVDENGVEGKLVKEVGKGRGLSWKIVVGILGGVVILVAGVVILAMVLGKGDDGGEGAESGLAKGGVDWRAAVGAGKKFAINELTEFYDYEMVKLVKTSVAMAKDEYGNDYESRRCFEVIGLKDKTIQDKINVDLKDAYDGMMGDRVYCSDWANFGGVLSAVVRVGDTEQKKGFNWRLSTGEQIEFEDIFLKGTDVGSVLGAAYYSQVVYDEQHKWCYEGGGDEFGDNGKGLWAMRFNGGRGDLAKCVAYVKAQVDMEEVERAMNIYNTNGVEDFYFDRALLSFKLNGVWITERMERIWNTIAIYKRFGSDDLALEDSVRMRNFVFTDSLIFSQADRYDCGLLGAEIEEVGENIYVAREKLDFSDSCKKNRKGQPPMKILERVDSYGRELLESIKVYAAEHKDKLVVASYVGGACAAARGENFKYEEGEFWCDLVPGIYEGSSGKAGLVQMAESARSVFGGGWGFSVDGDDWRYLDSSKIGVEGRVVVSKDGEILGNWS